MGSVPAVSVVLCTFNRSRLLPPAIHALLDQATDTPPYEVIVVNNNSTDATRDVVSQFLSNGLVRYEFEAQPGLSIARNRGVAAARAEIVAFTDDDVRVSRTWIQSIVRAFDEHPDVDLVGGRVEPEWEASPPVWLARAGHAPLALADYGNVMFRITASRPVCLIGANMAARRSAFDRAGGFSPRLQRVGDGVGSTEDHDFQNRLLATGAGALYDPRISARAVVPKERLSKRYHRAWHGGHGRFYAMMREPSFERSNIGTFLGVPAHVYRRAVAALARWAVSLLSGRTADAFGHELRFRFLSAFARQRIFERS